MIESIITGGGAGTLILALAYAWQQWRGSRREDRAEPREAASATVTNAEVTNSMLLASLEDARTRETRLEARVDTLEAQNADLHQRLFDQRREYEREIQTLRQQVAAFEGQLDQLQSRLRAAAPEPDEQ